MGCCYQQGVVTYRVLLPNGCCYQMGVVTKGVLIPNRCCYQKGVVTKWVMLPNKFCYQTGAVNNQVLLKPGLKTDCPYVMSCWLSIPAVAEFYSVLWYFVLF